MEAPRPRKRSQASLAALSDEFGIWTCDGFVPVLMIEILNNLSYER